MARQLMAALTTAGHRAVVASEFRSFLPSPDSSIDLRDDEARQELDRIADDWERNGKPNLWLCYHPYYKAPDLLGPSLCRRFDIPYVTVESSYSRRRNLGIWADGQERVLDGIRIAAANICLTERDREGLEQVAPDARLLRLPPFIDAQPYLQRQPQPKANHLITVAMMRSGDKVSSYKALATALHHLIHLPWSLSIVGDGPARPEVEQMFAGDLADRIIWHGQKDQNEIADLLSSASVYLWPGHGEAYGLAYLEAQAAGVPVVAEAVAGVPEAVADGRSGCLVAPGDAQAYAHAVASLLHDEEKRQRLAEGARAFVAEERSMEIVSAQLDATLSAYGRKKT